MGVKLLVEVVVNKQFECTPFLTALEDAKVLPPPVEKHLLPESCSRMSDFRVKYKLSQFDVIVRCIEDIMPPAKNGVQETSASHSQMKNMLLPGYIRKDAPDFLISVSTAESTPIIQPEGTSQNGSVVFGGTFYMHDAHEYDSSSPSHLIPVEFQENNMAENVFELIDRDFEKSVTYKFKTPPNHPAETLRCLSDKNYISIGVVNIINYKAYAEADKAAYEACLTKHGKTYSPATIETTHGIVRMTGQERRTGTLFVSPITDRYGCFDEDVTDKQNYVAGYNAGIAVSELLVGLDELVKRKSNE